MGGHIGVDLLEKWLDRPSMRFVPVLVNLVGAVLFAADRRGGWSRRRSDAWTQISNMLRMPHWPFRLVVAFGSALYAIVLLIHAIEAARGVKHKTSEV